MNFTVSTKRGARRRTLEEQTFTIDRLWAVKEGEKAEVSHLVDRTYGYRSDRELRWHLAERFGLPVTHVALRAA